METVNIHYAKTHLSKLLERVAKGEDIEIAKAGKPIARLTMIEPQPPRKIQRIGFMKGEFTVPDDFDTMAAEEIALMYEGPL
jgi:prevent-host-death family protein